MTSSPIKYTYAQEEAKPSQEETIESVEEEETLEEESKETEEKEEEKTVETKEQTEVPQFPFGTILLAILIPSILIIIAYLIFKFVKF